ncbi:hypothetical protein ACTXT7_015047, partial [Hymenolepis weldensis]
MEDFEHYANFNVEEFIEEMVAQSESGEMFREYYGDIALMLRTLYIIATVDYDEDSDFQSIALHTECNIDSKSSPCHIPLIITARQSVARSIAIH